MTDIQEQIQNFNALRGLCEGIIESIAAGGELGASGGVLFAAMQQYGCKIGQFEQLMALIVESGRIEKKGNLYFIVEPPNCPPHEG